MNTNNIDTWSSQNRNLVGDICSLIKQAKELFGQKTYLQPAESDIEPITFARLYEFTLCFEDYISGFNIKQGSKIALVFPNSTLMSLLFLAVISRRMVLVPINPKCSVKEIEYILNDAGAGLLIYSGSQRGKIAEIGCRVQKVSVDRDAEFIKDIFNRNQNKLSKQGQAEGSLAAEIVYTSGTTGDPKGVILTHKNLLEDSFCIGRIFGFRQDTNFLTVAPLIHNSGQIVTTILPLWCGARTTAVRSDMGLIQFWYYVDLLDINWSLGMPAHVNFLLESKSQPAKNTMKGFFCGGAKLDISKQKEFEKRFSIPIFNNYGLTETTSIALCDSHIPAKRVLGSVGKPLFINEVKIFKDDKEAPALVKGEIRVRGGNVFKGYVNKPEVTSHKLKGGWVHTGDLGYRDQDGNFFIVDRTDNMIIVGGENVYPSEVENLLPKLKGIREGVLSSIPHKILGNELVFLYEKDNKNNIEIGEWKSIFIQYLSSFKIPAKYVNIDDLGRATIPKAANGKILRQKIKELLRQKLVMEKKA
jgi:long-chain acyl-CoA synthetase